MMIGRVFRETPDLNFSQTSGLRDTSSDWLIVGQLQTPAGFSVDSRVLVDDEFDITRSETLAGWSGGKLDLTAGHIFLPSDVDESRTVDVSEWTFDTTYRFNNTWSMGLDARYDVASNAPTQSGP